MQVPETLDAAVLAKMHAPAKPDVPIITANQLTEADGLIFGTPTRFGMMAAQLKAFFDSTSSLWQKGAAPASPRALECPARHALMPSSAHP
jgi:NAD(P)H dehydrogenase (quinone)